ncbi:hypothetical protein O3P69_006717 [Scylla paramamosain]|uniref:Endonuclease/exonuclease/phosphatase domain-containing protein n=1 Tax=Scylla paramamosain TaxID=85552 RepID=A0AAW0U0J9_SCYPA
MQAQGAPHQASPSHAQTQPVLPPTTPNPDATERSTASQAPIAASDVNLTIIREIQALRQEIRALRDEKNQLYKENQDLKDVCASQQANQDSLRNEIQAIKDLLTQIVADTRANKPTYGEEGPTMEAAAHVTPHHTQRDGLDLTLTDVETDNENQRTTQPIPPALIHPGQPAQAGLATPSRACQRTRTEMLPSPPDPPTTSPHIQTSPPVAHRPIKPKHHQIDTQRRAQSTQGGCRGLLTLVRRDIPAIRAQPPPRLGEQVDSLCVTVHVDSSVSVDVYNVYCRQRSNLDLLSSVTHNGGGFLVLSEDFNAHHPLLEP